MAELLGINLAELLGINKERDAQLEIYKKRRLDDVRYYLRGIRDDGTFPNFSGPLGMMFNTKPLERTCERYDFNRGVWVVVDDKMSDEDIDKIMGLISQYKNSNKLDIFADSKYSESEEYFEFCDLEKKEKYRFKKNQYHILIKKFIRDIIGLYENLRDTDIEFAKDEDEVENGISKFENELKRLLSDFEKAFLDLYRKEIGDDDKEKVNINGITLDSIKIKIKIRSKEELEEMPADDLHQNNEFNGFIEAFLCIYTLTCMIKDKHNKLERFMDKAVKLYPISKDGNRFWSALIMHRKLNNMSYEEFEELFYYFYYILLYNIKSLNIKDKNKRQPLKIPKDRIISKNMVLRLKKEKPFEGKAKRLIRR